MQETFSGGTALSHSLKRYVHACQMLYLHVDSSLIFPSFYYNRAPAVLLTIMSASLHAHLLLLSHADTYTLQIYHFQLHKRMVSFQLHSTRVNGTTK